MTEACIAIATSFARSLWYLAPIAITGCMAFLIIMMRYAFPLIDERR